MALVSLLSRPLKPAEALDDMDNDSEVAIPLLQWLSKFPGVSKKAVGELLQLMQKLMT